MPSSLGCGLAGLGDKRHVCAVPRSTQRNGQSYASAGAGHEYRLLLQVGHIEKRMAMTSQVSEKEARDVAESAREQEWKLPSFGKELFMGNFQLDLIHPQPKLDPAAIEKGEKFLADVKHFLVDKVDPRKIEREAKVPDEVLQGFKDLGALGMKVPEEYGGLGLSQVYYNRALALVGLLALVALHPPLRPPVDRRRRAADAVRLRGAEAAVAAQGGQGPRLGLPAHRARRGLRPRPPRRHRHPHRGRLGLRAQRPQAVGDQRRDRRHRRGHGQGAEERRPARAASAPSCSTTTPTASPSRTATSSWACAASRTRRRCSTTSSCRRRT